MMVTEQGILSFLSQELVIDVSEVSIDTPLFSSGIVDSFALVSLIMHIEEAAGARISPADVNLANFDSISRLMKFVERLSQTAKG